MATIAGAIGPLFLFFVLVLFLGQVVLVISGDGDDMR